MEAGHGCLGCSEPGFWDMAVPGKGVGFYKALDESMVDD
jgi:Ni,Fe-hydrogenase I small subunit